MTRMDDRLPPGDGQLVQSGKPLTFYFEGRPVSALQGDTVASALFADGRRIFSRSFKYHRPRGLLCCSQDCPNCLMEVDGRPNQRSCGVAVQPGMRVRSQHAWPSLDWDLFRVIERLKFFLPIGFYYKTLYKPRWLWKVAEPVIRRLAGLGRVRDDDAHSAYQHRAEYVDTLIVGGGPAGMEAAKQAAANSSRVLLVDRESRLGGHLRFESREYDYDGSASPGYEIARRMESDLASVRNVKVLTGATAFGSYEGGLIPLLQGQTLIHVRAKSLIVATGAHQYPPVFRNNDLPGVMLSRAALRLMNLHCIRPGKRAVIVTANDEGYFTALECSRRGIEIAAVVDARPSSSGSLAVDSLRNAGIRVLPGAGVMEALGSDSVTAVRIGPLQGDSKSQNVTTLACDLVLLSTGWQGNSALLLQSGCELVLDDTPGQPVPARMSPGIYAAGEVVGLRSLASIVQSGQLAGKRAAPDAPKTAARWWAELQAMMAAERDRSILCRVTPAGDSQNFVCLCEDVSAKDLRQGVEEGFDEIETLKRYSTVSMGPCQGRMCSRNSTEICGHAAGKDFGAVGITTNRPPIAPVPLGALAGPDFHPVKRTAMHYRHVSACAEMMNMGVWKRPLVYTSVAEEYEAVRHQAGLIDISTLGKLLVVGSDAPRLLDKVYTHWVSNLRPGRARYGVICDDNGTILDDGTVARLGAERFYITTSTGNIDFVEQWMKWWIAGTGWCVHVLNVTSGMAAVNVAGPHARATLQPITNADLADFSYMSARESAVAGVPATLLRVGFVGETGWEIHFPAECGEYVWNSLLDAGQAHGLKPFGVEAQRLLRLEKKHVIVGQDTDALSNPYDTGMKWAVRLDKPDFIGRHACEQLQLQSGPSRLVGLRFSEGARPEDGSAIVVKGKLAGRVSSARFSPHAKTYIGLAWVPAECANPGTTVQFSANGRVHPAVVVDKPFYDPEGERLK